MDGYRIEITMNAATVSELTARGFYLYAAHDVPSSEPAVWLRTQEYTPLTLLAWTVQYQACVSSMRTGVELGQVFTINDANGTGFVSDDGVAGAIAVRNNTVTNLTCSIASIVNGVDCGFVYTFPLLAMQTGVVTPRESVLLMFATEPVDTGTVIAQVSGPCLRVDMTGAPDDTRELAYTIAEGWSWDGGAWAVVVDNRVQ